MGKSTKSSNTKTSSTKKSNTNNNGRPKPMTPKAGYTQTRRRYDYGGSVFE